jgi:non-specific serine/threonine protein kinase/serine/threonine-protein kinase
VDGEFAGVCPACAFGIALENEREHVPTASLAPDGPVARSIGPYRLLQRIGEGGMGEVWLAEQTHPVRRRVALKVIKPGMDSRQIIARFEAERQALAMMDHPYLSKVFDAGTTDEGRPYFVMEHVAGVPITEHCDREGLTTRERVDLFLLVCEGVQHAHQKAILHRDLKPSNVLVAVHDGVATPKIIDFGVAKAMAQPLTERSLYTEVGSLIGTPEYMSPEQADLTVLDVDTRTDVYALGVLLYELLTGSLPIEPKALREAGFDAMRRMIRETEPPKPSARWSSPGAEREKEAAASRRSEVGALRRQISGDLDWIVMKAIEKERGRRYGSPSEMASDLRRHLRNEPVLAGPPSAAYRAGKFVRRHRIGVALTVASLAVLVAFAVTMAVQRRRIAAEREVAERVSEFLASMLANVSPQKMGTALWRDLHERVAHARRLDGAPADRIDTALSGLDAALDGVNSTDTALRLLDEQVLAPAGRAVERDLAGDPRIAGRLEHTLGVTYRKLGLHTAAELHAQRALDIRRRAFGEAHPDTLQSLSLLALVYERQERYDEAEKLQRAALAGLRRALGPDATPTLYSMNNLANVCQQSGKWDEAERLDRELLERRRRTLGPEHPDTLKSANNLANVLWSVGRNDEAEKLHRETLATRRRVLSADDPDLPSSMHNLANVYRAQRKYEAAEAMYREAYEIRRRTLGEDHYLTIDDTYSVGVIAAIRGDRAAALDWLRRAIEHGYTDRRSDVPMAQDDDLKSLRGDPVFDALAARAAGGAKAP